MLQTVERLNEDLNSKVNIPDMERSIEELRDLIRTTSITVNKLEEKLAKVILPEETRFYLTGDEVLNFQSNFNTLKAMMNKFDKLYKNLVNYQLKANS